MIKNNIFVIVLILMLTVGFIFLQFAKLSISISLKTDANTLTNFFCKCPLIIKSTIEYDDSRTTIIGGNCLLLPQHGNINLQAAVRKSNNSCSVVIGYPALPLESY